MTNHFPLLLMATILICSCNKDDTPTLEPVSRHSIYEIEGTRLFEGKVKSWGGGSSVKEKWVDTISLTFKVLSDSTIEVTPLGTYEPLLKTTPKDSTSNTGWLYYERVLRYSQAGLSFDPINNKVKYWHSYQTSAPTGQFGANHEYWEKQK